MFVLDIETLGISSESVILSAAIVHFESNKDYTFEELYSNSLFVKFRAKEQVEKYNRKVNKETIKWWDKQCKFARERSFIPSKYDIEAIPGLKAIEEYASEYEDPKKALVWIRGSLDQVCIDSLYLDCGIERMFPYSNYRDLRTAIDILASESKGGYCDIVKEGFDRNSVIKHDPVSDICLDAMMLMYHP